MREKEEEKISSAHLTIETLAFMKEMVALHTHVQSCTKDQNWQRLKLSPIPIFVPII